MPFASFSQNPKQTKYNCGVEVRIENLTIEKEICNSLGAFTEPAKSVSNLNTENFLAWFVGQFSELGECWYVHWFKKQL